MITIYVHKTQARAELDAPVTSGSVGREVQFQFSDDWNGLAKTAVFETNNYKETATVPVSGTLAIPEDVLAYPGFQLRIGVIGKTAGDATVIPTVYADCGMIKPGASTAPVSTPLTPSQAEQLQGQINDLENRVDDLESGGGGSGGTPNAVQYVPQTLTNEQKSQARNNIGAMAADAPVVKSVNGNTPDANGNVTVEAGGTGAVELDTTLTQSGKAADAKATGDALKNVGGVSTTEKTMLLSLFKNAAYTADMSATIAQIETLWSGTVIALGPVTSVVVVMWIGAAASNLPVEYAHNVDVVDGAVVFINGSSETFYTKASGNTNNYDILLGRYVKDTSGDIYYINPDSTYTHTTNSSGVVKESISYQKAQLVIVPEPTLTTGITASYTGGDVVIGTALSALVGIVVTASYSDGSTATVTGYTLSGTIVEGSNTITVSYGGKTTTFTVTGVADKFGSVELDTTLTQSGKAADAKAVGDALATLTLGQHTDGLYYIFLNGNPMGSGLELGEIAENPTLLTDLAEYFRTPTQEVVDAVNSYDDSVLSFVIITDTHGDGNKQHSQAIVNYLLENSKADKCFWLGDVCNGSWNPDEFMRYVTPLLKNKDKIFFAVGNHEYTHDGGYTDMSLLVEHLTAHRNPTDRFNFYHDDAKYKVRYIVVDTQRQQYNKDWIASAINTLPDGYKYLVFGHGPIGNTDGTDGVPWVNSDAATSTAILENNPQDCIGYFHGHEHVDAKHIVRNRYWEVCFTCDEFDNTNWYPGYAFTGRVEGTVTEQAVSVVSINIETGEVIVHRIGAGSGYTFNYIVPEHLITNQLTNVETDSAVTNVGDGASYTANLTAIEDYTLSSVMVTMGGVDITSIAYSDGVVFIESVTGDVVITASAVKNAPVYTSEGYLANGLTWQVDGINNTGNGHSAEATEWVDLVNGNNLAMLDPAGLSWGDDCLAVNGSVVYHDNVPVDGLTIELVFQNTREAAHNFIATFAANAETPAHILALNSGNCATFISASNVYTNLGVSCLDRMAITIVYGSANSDAERVYVNGTLLTEMHNSSLTDNWTNPIFPNDGTGNKRMMKIGGYQNGGGSFGMTGNIYSFRAYSRQLTTEEVQANYAVDVERFGLTN